MSGMDSEKDSSDSGIDIISGVRQSGSGHDIAGIMANVQVCKSLLRIKSSAN